MSYRVHEHPHHHARRTVENITTPMRVWTTNGTTADIAFPCYYQEIVKPIPAVHHDIHWHHHVGWPVYNHPDHICQMMYTPNMCGHKGGCKSCRHYLDARTIFPIHLLSDEEGPYENLRVVFWTPTGKVDGISTNAWIDDWQDWIVRVQFETSIMDAIEHPMRYRFTVFGDSPARDEIRHTPKGDEIVRVWPARTDAVGLGELVVLPSGYDIED